MRRVEVIKAQTKPEVFSESAAVKVAYILLRLSTPPHHFHAIGIVIPYRLELRRPLDLFDRHAVEVISGVDRARLLTYLFETWASPMMAFPTRRIRQ
jgi:hypothetical protein